MAVGRQIMFFGPEDGSVRELAAVVAYLDGRHSTDAFTRLAAVFGSDFATFMAVFQQERITIPSRLYLERTAFYCRVWLKVIDKGSTKEAFNKASKHFDLPVGRVKSICDKVDSVIGRRRSCLTMEMIMETTETTENLD